MVFMSAINPRPAEEGEQLGPIKWIDDHERKLFWTIWLPRHEHLRDWKTIPESLDFARTIHENRLQSLYVDPDYATHGAGATILVNVMRIPCFGRRITIGRASIIWPGAN